jgi:hypothetical protein
MKYPLSDETVYNEYTASHIQYEDVYGVHITSTLYNLTR